MQVTGDDLQSYFINGICAEQITNKIGGMWKCSVCGAVTVTKEDLYCMRCGAKMEDYDG